MPSSTVVVNSCSGWPAVVRTNRLGAPGYVTRDSQRKNDDRFCCGWLDRSVFALAQIAKYQRRQIDQRRAYGDKTQDECRNVHFRILSA
jgi:hypothetical protein